MNTASLATALSQQQLALEVGARLAVKAKDHMDLQGDMMQTLLDSTGDVLERSVKPHVGASVDIRA